MIATLSRWRCLSAIDRGAKSGTTVAMSRVEWFQPEDFSMGSKKISILMFVATASLSLPAEAQFQQTQLPQQMMLPQPAQQWGSGLYGGNQACPYNPMSMLNQPQFQPQIPAVPPEDPEIVDLKKEQADLKEEKRDDAKSLRELETKKTKYSEAISDTLNSDWAQAVTSHLESGDNCSCPVSGPNSQPTSAPDSQRHRGRGRVSELNGKPKCDRMPASEGTISAAADLPANPYDQSWMGGNGSSSNGQSVGGNGSCDDLHASQPWRSVCVNGGTVSKTICHNHYFAKQGVTGLALRGCDDAIEHYGKVNSEIEKLNKRIGKDTDRIAAITTEIRDLKREAAKDKKDNPSSTLALVQNSGPSLSSMLPFAMGMGAQLGSAYLGYQNNQANNALLGRQGFPAQPFQSGSMGYPFMQSGIYGSVASAQTGAFGCSGGMMPGMPNGLAGMPGYNQQGAFQSRLPNYQASLYGGNSAAPFPAYLGLGQSLSPMGSSFPASGLGTSGFPASGLSTGGLSTAPFPASSGYGSASSYMYGRSQIGTGR
jgi:uncharacterized protein